MLRLGIIAAVLFAVSTATAGPLQHSLWMSRHGRLQHASNLRGSEVIAKVGRGFGQRARAMAMWRRSPPHARVLKARGLLRVRCWKGFCTGRK